MGVDPTLQADLEVGQIAREARLVDQPAAVAGAFGFRHGADLVERAQGGGDAGGAGALVTQEIFGDPPAVAFLADPVGMVRRIHEHFDWPWSEAAERSIHEWSQGNRQHQHGVHEYSAEEYGLSEGRIEERFADYISWEQQILRDG